MQINVRKYEPGDRAALDSLHERHDPDLWYANPDDPINVETWLVEIDGLVVAAVTGRHTIEAFLMIDKSYGTPAERWEIIQKLVGVAELRADELGIREVHINIPKKLRGYAKRLLSLESILYDDRLHLVASVCGRLGG